MDEDLRHESYKEHEITSRPVSIDLPGSDHTWQVRIDITSPDGVIQDRLLENPFYKNKADALTRACNGVVQSLMQRSTRTPPLEFAS